MINKKYSIYDIFTPSYPASLTFIERQSINEKLDRAFKTKGKQIILYGHSGSGKTTIIHNKITEYYPKKITTRCIKGMTVDDIMFDAFSQLDIYYKDSIENSVSKKINTGISAQFLLLQASINAEISGGSKEVLKKVITAQLTAPTLAKFIGDAGCCWIIEDFHKIIQKDKDKLAQILKVFMDTSVEYPKLKIITIGAVNTAREVIQYDKEMKNRVAEINVPLMAQDKLRNIINVGEDLLNIEFDSSVIDRIITLSFGLPAVTHNLCLLMC